jgi:hypothetical protein
MSWLGLDMSFIMVWKVAGELVNPKNITSGSNNPLLVPKGSFPLVSFLDLYVVKTPPDVQFGEVLSALELVD